MTALLTADEAARLRHGEQLVIVRAGERVRYEGWVNGERRADLDTRAIVAPQDWVALTGPCPHIGMHNTHGDCRDGRKLTDFGDGVKAIVVSVEPEPDGRNWRITLEVPS